MPYDLDNRLVIGLASSALFDLEASDRVFREEGEDSYRKFQREHQDDPLEPGVAFSFIRKLLSINELKPEDPPIEVMLLSRNDPDTGLRVMKSIEHHGLGITRAVFLQGRYPHKYIQPLSISLFLSANEEDVVRANSEGCPAGQVLASVNHGNGDDGDGELRIAFDFDGVLADDEAETIYQETKDLKKFHDHERELAMKPHNPGPLAGFLRKIARIQKMEEACAVENCEYKPKLRVSIVTARNAPAHERVINTMRDWNITVNEAFFLGGISKGRILETLRPHIFFDDQKTHLEATASKLPSVHIPFGVTNRR